MHHFWKVVHKFHLISTVFLQKIWNVPPYTDLVIYYRPLTKLREGNDFTGVGGGGGGCNPVCITGHMTHPRTPTPPDTHTRWNPPPPPIPTAPDNHTPLDIPQTPTPPDTNIPETATEADVRILMERTLVNLKKLVMVDPGFPMGRKHLPKLF